MAAGTIPISMTQQLDIYGQPLAGGQLYIIQAGTVSTPQDAFQDVALTIKQPYPMTLDAAGRVPQFFLDNSVNATVKIRLQDKNGVVQLASDGVLIIGPAGGTGGGGGGLSGDPSQLIQMGNMIFRYGIGALAGYVRTNGLTIGTATSGATERANADCQNLFQYLWGADTSLVLTPSRGANAAADWTANKQLALPDWRGYAIGALDDMGNSAAGRLGAYFANATILGSAGGASSIALGVGNLPQHSHSGTTGTESATHTHSYTDASTPGGQKPAGTGTTPNQGSQGGTTGTESAFHTHLFSSDTNPLFLNTPFPIISPRKLCTFYLKL